MIGILPRRVISAMADITLFWNSTTVNFLFGFATSSRWCVTLPISFLVILLVPISSPLYICLESAEIISPFIFLAIFTAKLLLPVAVCPKITITVGFFIPFPPEADQPWVEIILISAPIEFSRSAIPS